MVRATHAGKRPVAKPELNWTRAIGKWPDRKWEAAPAQLDTAADKVTAVPPAGVTVWNLNLFADRKWVVSTGHEGLSATP